MKKSTGQSGLSNIDLSVPLKTICYIVSMARGFDVKEADTELGDGSNPIDDKQVSVLEDRDDDPAFEELVSVISDLNEDEQIELVALMWLGRDDYTASDWEDLCEQARNEHNERTAQYLVGSPLLSDYLEEGLSLLGYSCSELD